MPLVARKRISLWRSRQLSPGPGRREPQSELWANLKFPTRRPPSPISFGFRYRGVTWTTRRGFASIRSRRLPGISWQDRD
jgi:hypothetical protein